MSPSEEALVAVVGELREVVQDLRIELASLRGSRPPASSMDPHALLPAKDVARMLGISPRTLRRERKRRVFPKPVKGRGRPRWRRRDILAYLERAR